MSSRQYSSPAITKLLRDCGANFSFYKLLTFLSLLNNPLSLPVISGGSKQREVHENGDGVVLKVLSFSTAAAVAQALKIPLLSK